MSTSLAKRTIIYLLRNDLRVHDNECLKWANENADHVIPLYCFDPDHYSRTHHFGFAKTGLHRARFLVDCINDLRASLGSLGSNLIVRSQAPVDAVKSLVDLCHSVAPVSTLVYQQEITAEELKVEEQLKTLCKNEKIKPVSFWGATLYHLKDIPYAKNNIPNTYTEFRKGVEIRSRIRPLVTMPDKLKPLPPVKGVIGDIPSVADLGLPGSQTEVDARSAFPFKGGEVAALARVKDYLWNSDAVASYKETRNGLVGENYSTKFSAWLASGSLSPRHIYHSIKQYESERQSNQSTYWVIFELIWRDYFRFVCLRYEDRVFYPSGIMGRKPAWKRDMESFEKWKEGRTGVPFVDANMRELRESGWMSNRGRQNVASFLVKDLALDWRLGAEWFESQLIDHDVCSNYGNWNYAAGIGNDPRENRKFNMIKQAIDYDPDGDFVRLWVREIAKLPNSKIHYPWALASKELRDAGIELGVSYPQPVLVAPEWNKHMRLKENKAKQGTDRRQKGIDFYFKSANSR